MKKTTCVRLLSLILCLVLIRNAALLTGCTGSEKETPEGDITPTSVTEAVSEDKSSHSNADGKIAKLGEGETVFSLTVTDGKGNDTAFEISTDKTTVGDALLDLGLIEGDDGPYGLYVKRVNGIFAEYETTGTYWAFYVNGEYAVSGVDTTKIVPGDTYQLKIEK